MNKTKIVQNEWQYGICECYRNPGICCKVCFWPLCVTCANGDAVDHQGCFWCLMTTFVPCVSISIFRSATREQYGIEGTGVGDWLSGVLCPHLVTCQTAAEHEERTGNHVAANVDRILNNA